MGDTANIYFWVTMLSACVFAIIICFMKYDTSARAALADMTVKLRFFSLGFLFFVLLTGPTKFDIKSGLIAVCIVWIAVSIFTLISRKFNPLKLPTAMNIIFAILMFLLSRVLK